MCNLTLDEINWLKEFNQLLNNIQTMLVIQLERLQAELLKRFYGLQIEVYDFEIDVEIIYYLRKDDPEFTHVGEQIIAVRNGVFSAQVLGDFDWGTKFEKQFGFKQHCWLFHELHNNGTKEYPSLSVFDILRIGDLCVHITPQHPYHLDPPLRNFEFRYVHPSANNLRTPYMTTYSGKHVLTFPHTPRRNDIDIEDIIQGLSNQCKYFGQTKSFYSIAQHCLHVASLLPEKLRPAALIYTASSAYIGESQNCFQLPTMKRYVSRLEAAIANRFSVPIAHFEDDQFVRAHRCVLLTERRDVIPELTISFSVLASEFRLVKPMKKFIVCLSPEESKRQYRNALKKYLPHAFDSPYLVS